MKIIVYLMLLLFLILTASVSAESTEAKFIIGTSAFVDEETPFDHFVIGGAFAYYLTERFRIEPQFLYMDGPGNHHDYTVTGNIAYDVYMHEKTSIYIIGGVGFIRQTDQFLSGPFSSYDGTTSGGVGLKQYLGDRFFIAPEFRMGFEPLFQLFVSLGYSF